MTTMFTPVEAPPLLPPVVNLVTSSRDALAGGDPTEGKWENGFAFQPRLNVDPAVRDTCVGDGSNDDAPSNAALVNVETTPWMVEVEERCSTFGYKGRDYIGRAVTALAAATPKGVEREFSAGAVATAASWPNLFLQNGGATDVTPTPGTAVSMVEAYELLEKALADCRSGSRGMIHTPVVGLASELLLHRDGPLLLTLRDTIVVPGVGYDGAGPDGTAATAGTVWLYATGIVDVRLGEIEVFGKVDGQQAWLGLGNGNEPKGFDPDRFTPALIDRTVNDVIVPARRMAAATWDGTCHFAVLANINTGDDA